MITTKGSPQSIAEKIADPLDKYGTKRVRVDVEATLTLQ